MTPQPPFTGSSLKQKRETMLLSQKDLADLLKVSVTTISNWETGKKKPTLQHQRYLNAVLNPRSQGTKKTS